MQPLPATAEALDLLVAAGDEGVRTRVAWICETLLEVAPLADAFAIWFTDEDLTLVHSRPSAGLLDSGTRRSPRTSLALTFATGGRVGVVVTLYSGTTDAFAGRVDLVERRLGAVRGASLLDGDLGLASFGRAELAPAQLRSRVLMDTALGMLMGTTGLSLDEAEVWLRDAARASSRTVLAVATQVVTAHDLDVDDLDGPLLHD